MTSRKAYFAARYQRLKAAGLKQPRDKAAKREYDHARYAAGKHRYVYQRREPYSGFVMVAGWWQDIEQEKALAKLEGRDPDEAVRLYKKRENDWLRETTNPSNRSGVQLTERLQAGAMYI